MDQVLFDQIEHVISTLQGYIDGNQQFTLSIDDPSGNSYIENLCVPNEDPKIEKRFYKRTREQTEEMGFNYEEETKEDEKEDELPFHEQIHTFPGVCSRCSVSCETKMHMLDIPHFKEVIIMSTNCDSCGYKSNEVKAGGAIAPKGKIISLVMQDVEDLNRDILKSETCGLKIPEIELELTSGTLGGRFTTVEGLLTQVLEELETRSQFVAGDSAEASKSTFKTFLDNLRKVLAMEIKPFTLVLDDPLSNSHLQNLYAPDPDPNMKIEEYERTWEQNEVYGLNDIKVDNYEEASSNEDAKPSDLAGK